MARWPLGKARLSSAAASSPGSVGARSWGQVGGWPGRLRALQGRDAATGNTGSIAGKALDQALIPDAVAARRILHGKEAVPGSSPGEGLNTCKPALFHNY